MKHVENFLSGFSPLMEDVELPQRIQAEYVVDSCLAAKEDGSFVWRLRRKTDEALFVLKMAPDQRDDLEEEYRILKQVAPCLPGAVPEAIEYFKEDKTCYLLRTYLLGETLTQWREREGGCSEEQCIALGQQLCKLVENLLQ